MIPILIAIQNISVFTDLRSSAYMYPALLALHLAGISLFGGLILITDLRILGAAMKSFSIADVIERTRNLKRIGLVFAAGCGVMLFCSKAEAYYYNDFFRAKVVLFALVAIHAVLFKSSIYNQPESIEGNPSLMSKARAAAWVSLVLWTCILIAGRGIGYIAAPFGLHFAGLLHGGVNAL
ncbi:MAG: DUF6644 family protein [Bryobacteraceae bacterium]